MADTPDRAPPKRHSLADHLHGEDFDHAHEGDEGADHDHDHFDDTTPLEENPLWIADHVTLKSVGIDIGSSGTQVLFSELKLRRLGEDLSSRYGVVSRDTVYQAPVALTPYASEERIDETALGRIIDRAYGEAKLHPDDVDTGVVILTGEALRRDNAQAIAGVLAEQGGEFVCATAGHHMEAMLAAYGSGAARVSHDAGSRLLNIDVGGGTTKLGLVDKGRVIATAAVHVGGRLTVVDAAQRVTRLDPAGARLAQLAGRSWTKDATIAPEDMDAVADWMAGALIDAVRTRPLPPAVEELHLTEPIDDLGPIDGVMFSGGVGEYVYGRETRDFGDMGRRLGRALRRRVDAGALPWPLLPAGECIRATALGASEYSVQLSGNTVFISDPASLLPRRNLQVLQPAYEMGETIDPQDVARAIAAHFRAFDLVEGEQDVALAFRWCGVPSYERVAAFAQGLVRGVPRTLEARRPLYVILDGDIAQTLGALLREEPEVAGEVLAIDGITLWDFDYIDLGRIRMPSFTVPVTVKSLVFSEDPRVAGARHRTRSGHAHGHAHPHPHGHDAAHDHAHPHAHDHGLPAALRGRR